jgi:DNA-directed RNA polymerase subunit RPC12/RpoP
MARYTHRSLFADGRWRRYVKLDCGDLMTMNTDAWNQVAGNEAAAWGTKPGTLTPAHAPDTSVRVYEYGIRLDRESIEHAEQQVHTARRLYNDLVAAMRSIYEEMQEWVLERAGDEGRAAYQRIQALNEGFARAKKANDEDAMKQAAQERKMVWRDLSSCLGVVRKAHVKELRDKFYARIGNNSRCETYELRCLAVEQGLGWATANDVLDRALTAWRTSMKLGKPPRFARGDDKQQDSLCLQFTTAGGVDVNRLQNGSHGELAIEMPPAGAGRRQYGSFRFRLGAAAAQRNATGTVQIHRALPASSAVSARLVRKRHADKWKWALQLVLRLAEPVRRSSVPQGRLVAVHFGWAADVTGRRVAGVADAADPGLARLVQLPISVEEDLHRAAQMQSDRDVARDTAVAQLKALGDDLLAQGHADDAPAMIELAAIKRLPAQHIAAKRFYRVQHALRALDVERPWLSDWVAQDRKRWQAATGLARRARQRRREFYRMQALELARSYSAVVIEPLDLRKAAEKIDQSTGRRSEFTAKARAGRTLAALYEFESEIRKACADYDRALFELAGETTVATCAHCGASATHAAESEHQVIVCDHCGARTGRKLNAAAMAWQVSALGLEERIVDFHAQHAELLQAATEEKRQRLARMAEGRKTARAARTSSDGDHVNGSRTRVGR